MPPKAPPRLETVAELATRLHVTQRTVQAWAKEGCPRRKNGLFNPAKVDAWLAQRPVARRARLRKERGASPPQLTELEKIRVQQASLALERQQLELDELRGALLRREDVERELVERIHAVRRGHAAVLQRFCARFELPDEAERALQEEFDWLCATYARNGHLSAGDAGKDDDNDDHAAGSPSTS